MITSPAPYSVDRSVVELDLSDNTNRWGAPPAALRVLARANTLSCTRYPESYAESLKLALAAYAQVECGMIVTGCGSDDVLDCAMRAFGEPGSGIVFADPTFVMIPILARVNRLHSVLVKFAEGYRIDIDMMLASDARLAYVCTPNNPTGTTVSRADLEQLVSAFRGVVIIDEAYAEFSDDSFLDLARRFENVLVVRTLSKAFGLAGLRVGYGVGHPALVKEVAAARGPFKVSTLAVAAAGAALREDVPWMLDHARAAAAARDGLSAELRARGIEVLPTQANFVMAPVEHAASVAKSMRTQGVAVRTFTGMPLISPELCATDGEALRITAAPPDEIERMLAAMDRAREVAA